MKKKFLLSVLALFVFAAFTLNVNAAAGDKSILNVEASQAAKAPESAPGSGTTLYSVVGRDFNLSKIKFGTVTGESSLNKIYLGTIGGRQQSNLLDKTNYAPIVYENSAFKPNPNMTLNNILGNWFTAYCLDGTKKYPTLGIYSFPGFYSKLVAFETAKATYQAAVAGGNTEAATTAQGQMLANGQSLVDYILYAALSNSEDSNVQNVFAAVSEYKVFPTFEYAGRDNLYFILGILSNLQSAKTFTIDVTGITFAKSTTEFVEKTPTDFGSVSTQGPVKNVTSYNFYALDLQGNGTYSCPVGTPDSETVTTNTKCAVPLGSETTVYELNFGALDVLFSKFKLSGNLDGREHALWILEHSYPALSLSDALAAAGTSLDAVKGEVCGLEGHEYADGTCNGLDNLDVYVENYIYGIVQYALWYSMGPSATPYYNGVDPAGNTIGDTITAASGSASTTNLQTFYHYLIQERTYDNYGSTTYTNEISLSKPAAGKEIFKESKTAYTYGPYKATYSVLEANGMNISAKNDSAELSKIKFIDEEGNTITRLTNGQTFYVVVDKKAKIGSVKLHLSLVDPVGFNPATNRGKVYSPIYVNAQNVMTVGKIESITVEKDFDLVYNPKTGVENIAVLLMVTLVAFSLGYLVLSYRAKPVGLN